MKKLKNYFPYHIKYVIFQFNNFHLSFDWSFPLYFIHHQNFNPILQLMIRAKNKLYILI